MSALLAKIKSIIRYLYALEFLERNGLIITDNCGEHENIG